MKCHFERLSVMSEPYRHCLCGHGSTIHCPRCDRITTTEELFNALDELVQAIDHPLGGDLEINIYWCLESGRAHWEAT